MTPAGPIRSLARTIDYFRNPINAERFAHLADPSGACRREIIDGRESRLDFDARRNEKSCAPYVPGLCFSA
jgi:hypothetical protein